MPLSELLGNAGVVSRLVRGIRSGRLPPSMLFSGPPGVGKLRVALNLAQALNCPRGGGDACGECSTCLRIARDEHGDVRVLRPEGRGGQLRAEGVREAVGRIPFRPFEGRRRVIILVDAERMNVTTANSILKALEEPPPWATLVLVTSNEAAILPTILSRCQIFRFSPIAPEEIRELLVRDHGMAAEKATLLAAVSGGGLARALELAAEPLVELRREALRIAGVVAEGGLERELVPWAEALSRESRLMLILELLLSILRDLAASLGGAPVLHRDIESEIDSVSRRAQLSAWLDSYSVAEETLVDLRDRYLNKRIAMSRLLVSFQTLATGRRER
jgi:DNA polymerase-3 subunit delta'